MAKFSDIPYFILNNFLNKQEVYGANHLDPGGLHRGHLRGGRTTISSKGGFGFDVYLLGTDKYYRLRLKKELGTPAGNEFSFKLMLGNYKPSELTPTQLGEDFVGAEIYFRKDGELIDFVNSYSPSVGNQVAFESVAPSGTVLEENVYECIHDHIAAIGNRPPNINYWKFVSVAPLVNPPSDWIVGQIYYQPVDWSNYINTNRLYTFFGNYFPSDDNFPVKIIYHGMKDFAIASIPENNRTTNFNEFLSIYYDQIHNEPYLMAKNLPTLPDPDEVKADFLYYIAKLYNVVLPETLETSKKRTIINALPDLLKRKGTYTSLSLIWKSILNNTTNYLNIYERWHRVWPVPMGLTPLESFEDQLMINYPYYYTYEQIYSTPPVSSEGNPDAAFYDDPVPPVPPSAGMKTLPLTGGAGMGYYYSSFTSGASGYPSDYSVSDQNVLSPHYKVEMDLSNEPLVYGNIIDADTISYLVDQWESIRPASRHAHYQELIAPKSDFTGIWRELYLTTQLGHCTTRCTQPIFNALPNCAVFFTQYEQKDWYINHNLNSPEIITQCFDLDEKLIEPVWVEYGDDNNIIVHFDHVIAGYAFMSKVTFDYDQIAAALTWTFAHTVSGSSLQEQYIMQQIDNPDPSKTATPSEYDRTMIPLSISVPSAQNMVVTFVASETGHVLAEAGQYIFIQTLANATWNIFHNLDYSAVQVRCYDGNNQEVYPINVQIIDGKNVVATFTTPIAGHAVVKAIGKSASEMITLMQNVSYIKFGDGTTKTFDPVSANDIEHSISDTYSVSGGVRSDNDNFYIELLVRNSAADMNISEIGVFDKYDRIAFYTKMSYLYKPQDVNLFVHYNLAKKLA